MFSTTLTVLDGYPRSLSYLSELYFKKFSFKKIYITILCILSIGSVFVITIFLSSLKGMVDFATTISFLGTPFFAILNYLLFKKISIKEEFQLSQKYKLFIYISFLMILAFTGLFIGQFL